MRALTPTEGKKATIIDYVNNIRRHGSLKMQRDWSLKKPIKEYCNEDEKGNFIIRVCQECFGTFQAADICPYCGAKYETTPMEIQNFKEIELKRIEEAKEMRRQEIMRRTAERIKGYTMADECKSFYELVEYGKMRGYKPGWAYIQAKRMKYKI